MIKTIHVGFVDGKIKQAFLDLKEGKGAEPDLYSYLDRAFDNLKKDPGFGIKIPRKLWPKEYIKKYQINNLWKIDLPDGWRVIESNLYDKSKSGNRLNRSFGMVRS